MVTIQKEEQEKKFYIEASPKGKTLNVRDELYNLVKNETLLYYSGTWLKPSRGLYTEREPAKFRTFYLI